MRTLLIIAFCLLACSAFATDFLVFPTQTEAQAWVEDFETTRYCPGVPRKPGFAYAVPKLMVAGTWAVIVTDLARRYLTPAEASAAVHLTASDFPPDPPISIP